MHRDVCQPCQKIWEIERKIILKARIITGVLAAAFAITILCAMYTVVFPIVVSLFCVVAVYEIEKAIGLKNIPIMILTFVLAALIPFSVHYHIVFTSQVYITFAIAYTTTLFTLMLLFYKKTRFEHVVISLFSSVAIPYAVSIIILFRDIYIDYPQYTKREGVFLILFALFSAWITDTFAYFVGKKFGKHKLCPEISPKKTVEGAIGGMIGALILNLALLFVFNTFFFESERHNSYLLVGLLSILLSGISMCGDLTASTLKRNYGVKDFGTFFPGHGGVMDRFDSCLFVLPVLYAFVICLA